METYVGLSCWPNSFTTFDRLLIISDRTVLLVSVVEFTFFSLEGRDSAGASRKSEVGESTTLIGVALMEGNVPFSFSCSESLKVPDFRFRFESASFNWETSKSDRVRSVFIMCSISFMHLVFSSNWLCNDPVCLINSVCCTSRSWIFLSKSSWIWRSRCNSSLCVSDYS